jgi:quinone-modifying oxidoreductase subunit QmoC
MVWAGWGLKNRLLGNVDVWLCHQCGDCSESCPRDVKPADVLSAVRQQTYRHYARPGFLGILLSDPRWLPLALAIPVAVIMLILSLAGTFRIPEGAVDYSAFFPHALLNSTFTLITLAFYLLAALGIGRFWKDMKAQHPGNPSKRLPVLKVLFEVLGHRGFAGCETRKLRKWAHMLLFFGFALLILVTLYAILAVAMHNYPLPIANPFKILGNLASLMIYTGLGIMVVQRIRNRKVYGKSGYADWLLLAAIFLLTLSGTLVQAARFGDWSLAYHLYFFHLVCVWFVIMYLPFTKLGHIFYRTTALVYARSIGRE